MGLQTEITSNLIKTPLTADGWMHGQSITDKVGFYGATPVVQATSASQAVIVDASGGVANAATGVVAITGTYNSTILANAIATIIAQNTAMRLALVNVGLVKGA